MATERAFTPWDFFKLIKELNEHEAELKIKLAQAGLAPKSAETRGQAA
jgi:hypothetical protein